MSENLIIKILLALLIVFLSFIITLSIIKDNYTIDYTGKTIQYQNQNYKVKYVIFNITRGFYAVSYIKDDIIYIPLNKAKLNLTPEYTEIK